MVFKSTTQTPSHLLQFRSIQINSVQPVLQISHTAHHHLLGQLRMSHIVQMRYNRPHRIGARLQLTRERRIIRTRLVLDVCADLAQIDVHALQHGQKLEPHVDQVVVAQKHERHRFMRQNVIEIGDERPIAVLLHHAFRTIDDVVKVLGRIEQRVLDEIFRHHHLQADDHDVQQAQFLDHFQGEALVGEQLDGHVNDAIAQDVRVLGHFQNGRDSTVVHDEGASEMLLVVLVGQHVQQEADNVLGELEF